MEYKDKPITIVKLGGSVITDKTKPYTIRKDVIQDLASLITQVHQPLIIAHGSGSFGHTSAKKYGGKRGYTNTVGISKVLYDALEINHLVMQQFIQNDIACVSFPPRCLVSTSGGEMRTNNFALVEGFLRQGIIPVIFGDVLYDTKWKTTIYSGEKTISELVKYLYERSYMIERIIQIGDTKGFLNAKNEVVKEITPENWKIHTLSLFGTNTIDVTGGMKHKIETALVTAEMGIPTYLVDGTNNRAVADCVLAHKNSGTLITNPLAEYKKCEYVVLVNEDNTVIGRGPKLETHTADTPRHRGFSVFLFNNKKQLLLQQRSKFKKTWPLVWSNSCCGHPKEDETAIQAGKRRLHDELQLADIDLTMIVPDFKYTCVRDGIMENEFCPVMVGFTDSLPIPNPMEVENTRWIDWEEWVEEVTHNPDMYSQWCREETMELQQNKAFQLLLRK